MLYNEGDLNLIKMHNTWFSCPIFFRSKQCCPLKYCFYTLTFSCAKWRAPPLSSQQCSPFITTVSTNNHNQVHLPPQLSTNHHSQFSQLSNTHHNGIQSSTVSINYHSRPPTIIMVSSNDDDDCFYIALFSTLKQTQCTRMWFYTRD